jgi:uncharacterized membrane protein YphA (DoxX/SURF4 family)
LIAGVFFTAGILKLLNGIVGSPQIDAASQAVGVHHLEDLPILSILVALAEVALALWLVWRPQSHRPMRVVLWLVITFTAVIVVGELLAPGWAQHCGCLGKLRLTLWEHMLLNSVLLTLAAIGLAPSGIAKSRRVEGVHG